MPPSLKAEGTFTSPPPHTIIFCPVQIAVCPWRALGAPADEIFVHVVSAAVFPTVYLPPSFSSPEVPRPPHTSMCSPVQTAVCPNRGDGADFVVNVVHRSY